MRRQRRGTALLCLLFSFLLIAAACSSDNKKATGAGSSGSSSSSQNVPQGGTLVIGAEQEPDCADWIGSCGGSSWGLWMMGVTTMPRAYDMVKDSSGNYVYKANIMLTGEPKVETSPKQKVTYTISDKAVWNDGQPITSTDFKYTWDQIANGQDIYDRTGYRDIESVDDSNPKVAVVTFKNTFADFKQLFGSQYGILPSHLLQGKDRDAEMKDGYKFSGGPWIIDSWNKGDSITLVPNPKWYGDKPHLDKVIFKIQADTSAEFQAFKAGETSVIYPQPQLDAVDAINAGLPDTQKQISPVTGNFEALWLNNAAPPFDDQAVRQAIGFALDRDAIVKRLFGGLGLDHALNMLNALDVKTIGDENAFQDYKLDLSKVDSLLTGDGWAKGSDGIYAKAGQKLSFTIKSTAGNKRRELTEQIIQDQLKSAGIDMQIDNHKAGDLFGDILPKGDFQAALYAQVLTSLGPSTCNIFCIKNLPTADNKFSGNNWTRTNDQELDKQATIVETGTDDSARAAAGKAADDRAAAIATSLPIDPLPNILLWNSKVVGPVQDNAPLGPFFNLEEWGVTG